MLRDRARYAEADREFAQAWALAERQLPAGDSNRLRVLFQYSGSLQRQQRFVESERLSALLLKEVDLTNDTGASHARMAPLRHARSLIGLARYDEAEQLLLAYHSRADVQADPQLLRPARETLAQLYEARGNAREAQRYRDAD